MANFCRQCTAKMTLGIKHSDFAGICKFGDLACVLCEGCGEYILVNWRGTKVANLYDKLPTKIIPRIQIELWRFAIRIKVWIRDRKAKYNR